MNTDEIKARIAAGYERAEQESATDPKPFGQTSEELYPYTYWWVVGYNQAVDEMAKQS